MQVSNKCGELYLRYCFFRNKLPVISLAAEIKFAGAEYVEFNIIVIPFPVKSDEKFNTAVFVHGVVGSEVGSSDGGFGNKIFQKQTVSGMTY